MSAVPTPTHPPPPIGATWARSEPAWPSRCPGSARARTSSLMPGGDRPLADESIFVAAQAAALGWLLVCVVVTLLISGGVAGLLSWPYTVALVVAFVWLPAYLSACWYATPFLEDPAALTVVRPITPVTVVVSGSTTPASTRSALAYLASQDHAGRFRVILVGGGLADGDVRAAGGAGAGGDRRSAPRMAHAHQPLAAARHAAAARRAGATVRMKW